jgi:hypothetical protein
MMTDRLVVNGQELDISDVVGFPISFSVSDIKEPQKRKRNLSKSIKLNGTQLNMNFFESTYCLSLTDVGGDDVGFSFDPTQRVTAKYYRNSLLVFDGLLQLNEVVLIDDNYQFNCTLFSNFIDIFMQLGDLKVSELGWSEYDHLLTIANVKASWTATTGSGYVYPLVDYGYNLVAPTTWSIGNLVPMVYCREVVTKLLSIAGVTFTSAFFDTILFKKLVLGFEGGIRTFLSAQEILNRLVDLDATFLANFNVDYNFNLQRYRNSTIVNLLSTYSIPVVISDITTQFDAGQGSITVAKSGKYKFSYTGDIEQIITNPNALTFTNDGNRYLRFQILRNGSIVKDIISEVVYDSVSNFTLSIATSIDLICDEGDVIHFQCLSWVDLRYTEQYSYLVQTVQSDGTQEIKMESLNAGILDGDNVELSTVIPDMKATDFFSGLIKAFNLYVSDPDIDGVITIEPLEDYYQGTNTFNDWSNKIDYNKEFKILPSSTIEGKNYLFRYQDEDDDDNLIYKNEFNQRYGNKKYVVQSTYQQGDRDYLLPFGLAVPVEIINTNLVVPRIVKDGKPYKGKAKLYFYNGLKTGSFRLTTVDALTNSDETSYPSVHHFDDWENPSFDLNFELVKRIYYGNSLTIVTTDNLFSRFHEKFIKEITGRDSKIVDCYAYLKNTDVSELDFSKLIMLNGVLFRLNEIKSFDTNASDSTNIELVRIIEGDSPLKKQVGAGGKPFVGVVINAGKGPKVISGGYGNVGNIVQIKKG